MGSNRGFAEIGNPWFDPDFPEIGKSRFDPNFIYTDFIDSREQRQATYRALFADEIAPELLALVRDTTNARRILGNDRFKNQIEAMLGRSVRPGRPGRPQKPRT